MYAVAYGKIVNNNSACNDSVVLGIRYSGLTWLVWTMNSQMHVDQRTMLSLVWSE